MALSWGTELWDKYPELVNHFNDGIKFLQGPIAGYIKERGELEALYAQKLIGLVKKYKPKEPKKPKKGKNSDTALVTNEEFTYVKAFREVI